MLVSIANPTFSVSVLRVDVIFSKDDTTSLLKNKALFFSLIISNFIFSILLEPVMIIEFKLSRKEELICIFKGHGSVISPHLAINFLISSSLSL